MKSFFLCLGIGAGLIFNSAFLRAAETTGGSLPLEKIDAIVLKFQAAYADTFNRRDARGMAALFTKDATFQGERGEVTQGRTTIEANLVKLMGKLPAGTKLEDTAVSSRAITPDVIVCHGISHRIVPDGAPTEMFFTRVLVRQGDQWLLAATQIARPPAVPKPPAPPR